MPDLKALGAWAPLLEKELHAPYFEELQKKVADAYAHTAVFPPEADVFHAFSLTPPERVRVVILGQDPYHEPGQAHGLAFSVQKGVKLPPSLQRPGLFPAGRLDKDTVGFTLITDDGDFAHRLLAPRRHVPKTYQAVIDAPLQEGQPEAFTKGLLLEDGTPCLPAKLRLLQPGEHPLVEVCITEGKYHQIKRMFGVFGHKVLWLKRTAMGGLWLDDTLAEGEARALSLEELACIWK